VGVDDIVKMPPERRICNLSELDNDVAIRVSQRLVSILLKGQNSFWAIARFNLNIDLILDRLSSLPIMSHDLSLVLCSFKCSVIELIKSTGKGHLDIFRLRRRCLVLAALGVAEHGSVAVGTVKFRLICEGVLTSVD
jgi:hypothetical protein